MTVGKLEGIGFELTKTDIHGDDEEYTTYYYTKGPIKLDITYERKQVVDMEINVFDPDPRHMSFEVVKAISELFQ